MDQNGTVNYIKLLKQIGNVCMTEHTCGKCQETGCFVGYARECTGNCMKKKTSFIENGYDNIPHVDVKGGYDDEYTLESIAYTLQECRSCKENHVEDCLVSVVRNCMEIIAFGDDQPYEGSTFMYLAAIGKKYPNQAQKLAAFYEGFIKKSEL